MSSPRTRDLREIVCDTSPLLYLHQIKQLELLEKLSDRVLAPPGVVSELEQGRAIGVDAPDPTKLDWIVVEGPASTDALRLVTDLGRGETEVLALALEREKAIAVLDDRVARRLARTLDIALTGTLGILVDGKKAGLIKSVRPLIDELEDHGFRLAARTRRAVLDLAGEGS